MLYTDVCIALYDYAAQDDDELTIHEGDVLFLIDGTDPDWAKVQLKPSPETPQPTAVEQPGLVPATYIERVESLGQATALYNYQAREPEELTIAEGTPLEVLLDDDPEWTFVRHNGQAGFVPTSYLDQTTRGGSIGQTEPNQSLTLSKRGEPSEARTETVPVAPPSPLPKSDPRDIAYWSVTEVTKKKKDARKGMLGVGDLQVFYSCTTDKSPVRQWSIEDLESYTVKKDTVHLVFARSASPNQLQFQLASRTEATAVADKIDLTRRKAAGQPLLDATPPSPQPPAQFPANAPATDPVTMVEAQLAVVLYDFAAAEDGELDVTAGQMVYVLDNVSSADWWTCQLATDDPVPVQGLVPASYLQVTQASEAEPAPTPSKSVTTSRHRAPSDTPAAQPRRSRSSSTGRAAGKKDDLPDPKQLRTWVDSSGSFKVEAAFLGLTDDGRIKLHKANGVRIAVPMKKFNHDAIAYIEQQTGQTLQPAAKPRRKVNTDFDWFDFFTLKCDINADRALKYATTFTAESLDDSSLDTITAELLPALGVHEDDLNKVIQGCQRALGKPTKAIKQVSFGGASLIDDADTIPAPPARTDSLDRDARLAQQLQSQEVARMTPKAAAQRRALSAIDERFERQRQIEEDELLARKLQSADRQSRSDHRTKSPRPALVDPFDNLDVLATTAPALSSLSAAVGPFSPSAGAASPQPLGLGSGARKSAPKRAPPAKSAPAAIHPQQILQAQKQLSTKPTPKAMAPATAAQPAAPPAPAKLASTAGFPQDDWTRQLPLPSTGPAVASPAATMALVPRALAIPLATALPNPLVPVPSGRGAATVGAPTFIPTRDPPPRPSTVPAYRPIAAPVAPRPPMVPAAVFPVQQPAPQFNHFQTQPPRPATGMPMSTGLAMNSLVAPMGMPPSVSAPPLATPQPPMGNMALAPSTAGASQDRYSVFHQIPPHAPSGVFQTSGTPSTSLPSQALVPFGLQRQQQRPPTATFAMVPGMHGVQPSSLSMASSTHHLGVMPSSLAPLTKVNSAPGYPSGYGTTPTNALNMAMGPMAPANYTLQPRPLGMMGAPPQQAMAWSTANPPNMLSSVRPPSLMPNFRPTSSGPMNLSNSSVFAPVNPPVPPTNRPYGVFSSANWRPSG
ncbi:cytoskeletal protein binding protein [Dimargaris xerosporica]|nr:cytoskeletal protein binding protein [Dimargaris xerosporica]